jgi:actin-like ATPase involved in cell morphogenesis
MARGLDVGTSYIVLASDNQGPVSFTSDDTAQYTTYKEFRDAFYTIKPTTPVATKMIEKGLQGKVFVKDRDGTFIILGQDAIEKAIERNESAKRPMYRGVVSSKEKEAKRVLAYILKEVCGTAAHEGEKLVFCVPAQPVDQEDDEFDVGYHEDVVTAVLAEQGYAARAINEAEALCYSELEQDEYTGVALSCGAGMVNCCVMLNGEPTVMFSTTKSGDWIDRMAAIATGEPDSVVQAEKENGEFTIGEPNDNVVLAAVSSYYERLIDYTTKNLAAAMRGHKLLPKFKNPLPVVIAGGTSQAKGFVERFAEKLAENEFPLPIKEVKHASDPLHAVARGCLIAANVL